MSVVLLTAMAWGQSSLKATSEIAAASQTTINGASVVSGMTVFSNNRIRTGGQGTAIINLGRLGRIEFGPNTDMTLRLSREGIGGELHSNHVVVSARAGVPITIKTPKGMITTDGRQPAALTIAVENKSARVITHMGEATVTSGVEEDRAKVEHVAAGEELLQSVSRRGATGVIWIGAEPVINRIATGDQNNSGLSKPQPYYGGRGEIWENTWTMIRHNPLMGVGLGAYQTAYPIYARDNGVQGVTAAAHNDYLQVLADAGVIGAAIALWFIIVIFRGIARGVRSPDPMVAAIALGGGAGLFGLLVHSLFDFNLHLPSHA